MFTGLIETTGTIRSLEEWQGVMRLTVAGPASWCSDCIPAIAWPSAVCA